MDIAHFVYLAYYISEASGLHLLVLYMYIYKLSSTVQRFRTQCKHAEDPIFVEESDTGRCTLYYHIIIMYAHQKSKLKEKPTRNESTFINP